MIIAIDIGNTSIKIAVVDYLNIHKIIRSSKETFIEDLQNLLSIYTEIDEVAVSNVSHFPKEFFQYLKIKFQSVFLVNTEALLPFNNNYQSLTLGNDRIALVAGALFLSTKNSPKLIIDAGTCVTYDFIDANKTYLGGAISPGLRLRYESLHNFTANLPLLTPQPVLNITGKNTETSIHSGVVQGLSLEIEGVVKAYKKKHQDLEVFITGGDSELLIKQFKNRFFAAPFLTLQGIYYLYQFNKNK